MYRKQARILVCVTEPLLCYMNSECVLGSSDTPIAGNNLIPIPVHLQCSCVGYVHFHTCTTNVATSSIIESNVRDDGSMRSIKPNEVVVLPNLRYQNIRR